MTTINPYINYGGNAEEAFTFYKSIFGGEFDTVMRYKDVAQKEGCEGMQLAESDLEKICHISLPLGNGNVLMANDVLESMGKLAEINNFSLSVNAESKGEAEKLFNDLAENGNVEMPLADTFWGAYFGILQDKFGIRWMVNYDQN